MVQGYSKIVLFPSFEAAKRKRVPFPCLGESNKFGILETFLRKKMLEGIFLNLFGFPFVSGTNPKTSWLRDYPSIGRLLFLQ